ncbi:Conserved membrane protein, GtcA family [Lactococcus piscium]|uniref:Conserved membrane protein, GtcA family n=1 Tax=Pseudolactococcus piscium TaxID=1364 RepID=A0A2A5RXL2_9LACT|nr:GtrA family protein [Lactococcus piscium]PCS05963.1 Conserved membrane protein, GtcA family [Lactococcus piscium]
MKHSLKNIASQQVVTYLVAGVGTTIIYFIIKMCLFSTTENGVISEIVAQGISILFAFFTNKLWVFEKTSNRFLHEFIKFVISRLLVLLLSVIANWYFVDRHPQLLVKTLSLNLKQSVFVLSLFLQVFTIILNYIFSKFLIFTKK